jgi:hypothetical protein
MSALCYILGSVARLNSSMWRYRVNFLPVNVMVVGLLTVGGFVALDSARDGLRNASTPVRVSLADIRDNPNVTQYVTVAGVDFPIAVYEYGEKGDNGEISSVEKSWSPLLDRETRRFLLVQKRGKLADGDPHEAAVTGMLRVMDDGVRKGLAAQNDAFEGVPVETRYMLVADERPGDATTNLLLSTILFGVVGLFALVTVKRNTIFQSSGQIVASPATTADPLNVRATGTFILEQDSKSFNQRFIHMPAVLAHLDNGAPAVFSNIDASNRFMGVTTSNRAGIWVLAIDSGSVRDAEVGFIYWGLSRQRALRFSYTDPATRKVRQAIIAADNDAILGAVVAQVGSGTLSTVGA